MSNDGSLGQRLKEIRKDYPLTLEELGEKVGVTHAFLSRIENNKVKPSDDLLKKLANVLDLNDSQDYLNEFRLLNGTFKDIDKSSDFYDELKSSGRLEIHNLNFKNDMPVKIVEKPFYKLNYLFESDYKIFYDIKTSIFGEKHATIELPDDILHQLYKDINKRIIEYIKENPELLNSISNPEVIKQYNDNRAEKRKEIYNYFDHINLNVHTEEFMREIFDDESLI